MSIIAIATGSGSAGKTTTSVAVAAILAEQGQQVRLIDLDPQGDASYALALEHQQPTISDVLLGNISLDDATLDTAVPGLNLVPADSSLSGVAIEIGQKLGPEQRLRHRLATSARSFDVTIIDCPGALGILTIAALVAADHAITVTIPTIKEMRGLPHISGLVDEVVQAYNPLLDLAALIPSILPHESAGAIYTEGHQLLIDSYGERVTPPIRRSVRAVEAYAAQQPLPVFAPREPVTADYRAVVADLQARKVLP